MNLLALIHRPIFLDLLADRRHLRRHLGLRLYKRRHQLVVVQVCFSLGMV